MSDDATIEEADAADESSEERSAESGGDRDVPTRHGAVVGPFQTARKQAQAQGLGTGDHADFTIGGPFAVA